MTNEIQHTMWTEAEIDEGLRVLPGKIARAATEEVEAEASMKKTKHILTLQEAAAKLVYREEYPKATASELNAKAYTISSPTRNRLIEAEKIYELKRIERERLQDTFNSIRKAATVNMQTMASLNQSVSRSVEKRGI